MSGDDLDVDLNLGDGEYEDSNRKGALSPQEVVDEIARGGEQVVFPALSKLMPGPQVHGFLATRNCFIKFFEDYK